MKRAISLLTLAAAGSVTGATAQKVAKADKQPNVLFVIFDDLRPELACYGEKHMKTPNIDAVAKEGVVFSRAYVQQAVSAATRASFLTGCYPNTTGVDYPYSVYFVETFLPSHNSLPVQMFENGYYSRTLGKVHHGIKEDLSEKHFTPKTASSNYALPENIAVENDRTLAPPFECADVPDNAYRDGVICDAAIETIKGFKNNTKGKPFFLAVGFQKPHLPFAAPKKYYDMYDPATLPLSPNPQHTTDSNEYSEAHHGLPKWAGEADKNGHIVSDARQRELRHAYFACVSFVDAQLGRIISELKAQGLYDNTIVVMIGDHGWHLGDNGMYGKSTNFERATRTPLIVRLPDKNAAKGVKCNALVEFVDIYPSICQAAGVAVPGFVEGTSFVPLMYNPQKEWKPAAFSQFPRYANVEGFSVRTNDYRYTEWRDTVQKKTVAVELYDHRSDPYEAVNIAGKNPETVKKMATILADGWRKALPRGGVNKSNNPLAPPFVGWGPESKKVEKEQQQQKKNGKKQGNDVGITGFESLMKEARRDTKI
ncbi:iduronate-2-sulfatase [Bacteroidia bacterium]|nr:iduronate-2-sulfatase [Bacteroidia bacterium]